MVSIFPRPNRDGTVTYRIQIRRKGLPKAIFSANTLEEAEEWKTLEEDFIRDPDLFLKYIEENRLARRRAREFLK